MSVTRTRLRIHACTPTCTPGGHTYVWYRTSCCASAGGRPRSAHARPKVALGPRIGSAAWYPPRGPSPGSAPAVAAVASPCPPGGRPCTPAPPLLSQTFVFDATSLRSLKGEVAVASSAPSTGHMHAQARSRGTRTCTHTHARGLQGTSPVCRQHTVGISPRDPPRTHVHTVIHARALGS